MGQAQPFFHQFASGTLDLMSSPLWQAYVLKRNLERTFKTPSPLSNLTETAKNEETTSIVDDCKAKEDNEEEDGSDDEEDSDECD